MLSFFSIDWKSLLLVGKLNWNRLGEKKKKKKDYKPALCVLGSSTVYFYCTWSINLSVDLLSLFFDIVFVSFLCIWDASSALL